MRFYEDKDLSQKFVKGQKVVDGKLTITIAINDYMCTVTIHGVEKNIGDNISVWYIKDGR